MYRRDLNKLSIVEQIIAALTADLDGYARSARAAHAEATDEQCKAENKYDTRGLEASYLARGQSRHAAEVAKAIQQFEALPIRQYMAADPIDVGAVVELERSGVRTVYYIGQRAGGMEINLDGKTVQVITPQSPLGQQIVGRKKGDQLWLTIGRSTASYRVAAVA